jgi:hypothetical protein
MPAPIIRIIRKREIDEQFVSAVETALSMLKCWQDSVARPDEASLTEFRDMWCKAATTVLADIYVRHGQYQVAKQEGDSSTIAEFQLIADHAPFIEPTGNAVLLALVCYLLDQLGDEAKRVGLQIRHSSQWSDEELIQLRIVLKALDNVRLRNDEVRRLTSRVKRELFILSSHKDMNDGAGADGTGDPGEDGPVEPSGFRWKGKEFSGLTQTAFRLLKFHWYRGTWKARYFNEDQFRKRVFDDPNRPVGRERVDSQSKHINGKFDESDMLLHMKVEAKRSFVSEIRQPKFDERRKRRAKRKKKS